MRNKIWAIILICLLVLLSCASCDMGSYYENDKRPTVDSNTPGNNPVDPDNPDDPNNPVVDDKHYVVTVYFGSQVFVPSEDMDITVVWRSKNNVVRVPLGQDGKADAGELDGNYSVYLTGLPSEYSYNPNGYSATSNARKVSILLTSIKKPSSGNGGDMYVNNGCYTVIEYGTYRTNVDGEDSKLFYEFKPDKSGVYSIVSWVNIYDDSINPYIHLYSGSTAFKMYSRMIDGGGAASDGGFCKNFRYDFAVSDDEIGNVCTFAVGAVSKTNDYPLYVDFAITYVGPYTRDYFDIRPQQAQQAIGKTPEPKKGESFVYADMGTMLFDARNFKVSPNTGKYHVYNLEKYADNPYGYGVGYGPMLLCDIKNTTPSYQVTTLYNANSVGPSNSNYLKLYNVWIEKEQKFAVYDYTEFIRVDYNAVCNSEGKCFVTEELRTFLQKFAENLSLYTDGVGPGEGTPEYNGYSANQDALWLFACGFYE